MPVVGRPAADIAARAEWFRQRLNEMAADPAFDGLNLSYDMPITTFLAEAHFVVIDAYKLLRVPPGARANMAKVAAVTAATVAAVRPFRPETATVSDPRWLYLNPMTAMYCAFGPQRHNFDARPKDEKTRLYKSLAEYQLDSLSDMFNEANSNGGVLTSDWKVELSGRDTSQLDLLVSFFVLLAENQSLVQKIGGLR